MLEIFKRNENQVINVNEIDNLLGKIQLIDIREPYEYNEVSRKTAKNIPMNTLVNDAEKYLSKEKKYYIVCQSGGRSSRTCSLLRKNGYDVINVSGGVGSYVGTKRR